MWQMIAGPNLHCSECRHVIQPGRLCLSELPEETPPGVDPQDFRNYCIGCPQCWSQGKHACYVRHLERRSPTGVTPRSLPCAHCGRRIGAREKASVDTYYGNCSDLRGSAGYSASCGGATKYRISTANRFRPLKREQLRFAAALDIGLYRAMWMMWYICLQTCQAPFNSGFHSVSASGITWRKMSVSV